MTHIARYKWRTVQILGRWLESDLCRRHGAAGTKRTKNTQLERVLPCCMHIPIVAKSAAFPRDEIGEMNDHGENFSRCGHINDARRLRKHQADEYGVARQRAVMRKTTTMRKSLEHCIPVLRRTSFVSSVWW